MKVIAPGYTQHAPATLNTIYKVELKQRNGKNRYCTLYIAKNTRSVYAKYYDGSRAAKDRRCDKTLGIKLPEDITNAEKALAWVQATTSKNGFVLKAYATELRMVIIGLLAHTQDHVQATAAYRSYPYGTAGCLALVWRAG